MGGLVLVFVRIRLDRADHRPHRLVIRSDGPGHRGFEWDVSLKASVLSDANSESVFIGSQSNAVEVHWDERLICRRPISPGPNGATMTARYSVG